MLAIFFSLYDTTETNRYLLQIRAIDSLLIRDWKKRNQYNVTHNVLLCKYDKTRERLQKGSDSSVSGKAQRKKACSWHSERLSGQVLSRLLTVCGTIFEPASQPPSQPLAGSVSTKNVRMSLTVLQTSLRF